MPPAEPPHPYVSRGGLKLRHALDEFGVDPTGLDCADLGCSTGGFTDCLLQHGAAGVVSVDTGYGVLAWKLRNDPRVTVIERANALHVQPPHPVDLVTIDMGWTPQRLCIPAALRWLRDAPNEATPPRPAPRILTLIKPHYELSAADPAALPRGGVLDDARAERVLDETLAVLASLGVRVLGATKSPISGGKGKPAGNIEYLALLTP